MLLTVAPVSLNSVTTATVKLINSLVASGQRHIFLVGLLLSLHLGRKKGDKVMQHIAVKLTNQPSNRQATNF